MLLGAILMICFEILRIFGGNRKSVKRRKTGQKNQAPTLQRGVPLLRQGRGEKLAPLGYAMG